MVNLHKAMPPAPNPPPCKYPSADKPNQGLADTVKRWIENRRDPLVRVD
jgi:hypothetical protein